MCAAAGGRGRRNLRRGGGSAGDTRISGGCGNRRWCPGIARGRRKGRRDAACTEIRQFRRSGVFLRCAQTDALSAPYFPGARAYSYGVLRSTELTETQPALVLILTPILS